MSVNAGTVTAAPSAPVALTASVAANGTVTVSIDAPAVAGTSPVTHYVVTARDSSGNVVGTCTAVLPATSCDITGLTPGQDYRFDAVAHNGNGSSSVSPTSVGVDPGVPTSAPGAPTDVRVSVNSDGTANVSFTAPASSGTSPVVDYTATAYGPGNAPISGATCTTTSTSCTISGIPAGTQFTVAVVAANGNGDSAPSSASVANNSSTPTTAPSAPEHITASVAADGTVTVGFVPGSSGSGTVTSYVVSAINANGVVVGTCTATPPATSCQVSGLNPSEQYTFSVVANSPYGVSAASDRSVAVDPGQATTAPSAPSNPVASVVGAGVVRVSFSVPATAGSSAVAWYRVTAYNEDGSVAGTCIAVSPATSCEIRGLSETASYTFAVAAANGNGVSGASPRTAALKPTTSTSGVSGTSGSGGSPSTTPATTPAKTKPSKPVISISLKVAVGMSLRLMNAPIVVKVSGLKPGSTLLAVVYSSPRVFGRTVVGRDGTVSKTFLLPSDLEPGDHRVVIQAVAADGSQFERQVEFTLGPTGRLESNPGTVTVLPATGARPFSPLAWAVLLLAAGAMMVAARRRLQPAGHR